MFYRKSKGLFNAFTIGYRVQYFLKNLNLCYRNIMNKFINNAISSSSQLLMYIKRLLYGQICPGKGSEPLTQGS